MAFFLTMEDGPFSVFNKIRELFRSKDELHTKGLRFEIQLALGCLWCTSVWMTFLAAGLWFIEPWIVYILAAMTVTILITKLDD